MRDVINRQRLTGQQSWVAQWELSDPSRQPDARGLRCERRQEYPAFEPRRLPAGPMDKMVGYAGQIEIEFF